MIEAVLVSILIFIGIIFFLSRFDQKASVSNRVRRMTPDGEKDDETSVRGDETLTPMAIAAEQVLLAVGINVEKFREENQPRFQQAGLVSASAPVYYLFCQYILSGFLVLLAAALLFAPAQGLNKVLLVLIAFIIAVLGVKGPDIFLRNATQKRKQVLQRSFPDTLDLLLVCVESGLALDGALARVTRELGRAHPAITGELNRTRMELTLLNDRAQALQNLADRTGLPAFRSLVGSLLQSEKFGTNLTETLRVLAEDYRGVRLMAAENKAGRLPALMTIPLICFMMPAMFLIILGPVVIQALQMFHQ